MINTSLSFIFTGMGGGGDKGPGTALRPSMEVCPGPLRRLPRESLLSLGSGSPQGPLGRSLWFSSSAAWCVISHHHGRFPLLRRGEGREAVTSCSGKIKRLARRSEEPRSPLSKGGKSRFRLGPVDVDRRFVWRVLNMGWRRAREKT